jgi:dephospho-CoA kinase
MIIGLTGGIGSGKSTIARLIQEQGYPVFDTDTEAKRLIVEDAELRAELVALLGADVYEGNVYRRDIAAQRIFADPALREQVNAAVHPAVARAIKSRTDRVLFVECAILFESGFDRLCNLTVAVTAPRDIRIRRVMNRDNADERQVIARMDAQMSDERRSELADIVICNDGTETLPALLRQMFMALGLPLLDK